MEHKKLGDIATYVNGYAFKPEDRGTKGLPIIRIQDLTGNSYDLGFYNGEYPKKIELNNGDILISWSASLGVYEWNRGKALLNQHIFKAVFDKLDVNKKYFVFAVKYNLKEMEKRTHGATMKHITKKDFDNVLVPFPPLNKQQEIAATLDKLQSIITHRRTQLEKLDLLVKARFVEMFGDCENKSVFGKEFTFISRGKTPKYVEKSSLLVINQACIYWNGLNYEKIKYNDDDYSGDRILIDGDILINSTGTGTLGRANVFYNIDNNIRFMADSHVTILRGSNCIPIYVKYYLEQERIQHEIYRKCVNGSTNQIELAKDKFKMLELIVPPLDLQTQFADFVKQVDKSKSTIQKELDKAQVLFDSLMQEYFG